MVDRTAPTLPCMPTSNYKNALPAQDKPLPSPSSPNIDSLELQPTDNTHTVFHQLHQLHFLGYPRSAPNHLPTRPAQHRSPWPHRHSVQETHSSPSQGKKMKSNPMFGFFSLKEPSQLALEEFAQRQRKQSQQASPSSSTGSSFVDKKLPANVPKVNSKWDGTPEKLKNRNTACSQTSKNRSSPSPRNTRGSQSTPAPWPGSRGSMATDSPRSPRSPPNTVASSMMSGSSLSSHQNDPSVPFSPASVAFPGTSWYLIDNDEPLASGALPPESPRADSFDAAVSPSPPDYGFNLDLSSDEFSDVQSESPASSTDSVDTMARDTAQAIFNKLNHRPHQGLWTEEEPAVAISTGRISDVIPESHDFLFNVQSIPEKTEIHLPIAPPSIQQHTPTRPVRNFSRPVLLSNNTAPTPRPTRMPTYRKKSLTSALPTLYEHSLVSTESLETIRDNSDACSIGSSSIAPSELSTHWFESPRERLGLGGRLRKTDVLPWEKAEDRPKKSRLLMFGRSSTRQ